MAVQQEEVRDIVDFAPEGFIVTSFYLNVDATEFPDPDHIAKSLDSTLSTARSDFEQIKEGLSHESAESLRTDLEKIEAFVSDEFQREDVNGLAIFSCSGQDFWQVIQLPTRVESRVGFGPRPYVAPIATFISHTKPTAILLTDRKHARILTMKGGEVREWTNFEDWIPQRSMQGGWSQMRYQRRSDHWAKHHVDRAAELVLELQKHYPFDWLILGTEVETEADLEQSLHPYVKDKVVGSVHVRIDAPVAEVVEQAERVREQAEGELIDHLVQQIQEYAGAGGRGTIGLKDTLQALNEQKVHILLVQEGYQAPGAECPNCGMILAGQPDACPACNELPRPVDNVVELAIQRAIELGSTVEVATEFEKLEPIQNIGSIMYY
ncbi:MAG: hypothetical protein JOZ41_12985 [Chloroflexi bacterium]|nr:hypothetical protein [Chloroflexota bacterium]